MRLHVYPETSGQGSHAVLTFGSGLIGSAITRSLRAIPGGSEEVFPFDWMMPRPDGQTEAILQASARHAPCRVSVVWAAGASGFGSDDAAMAKETALLQETYDLAMQISRAMPKALIDYHLISSAGGLFEGQRLCGPDAVPAPLRPYGTGKLIQETLMTKAIAETTTGRLRIYRPSSVYGYTTGSRQGLFSALIRHALAGHPARIVGALTTMRDYVFAPDIGQFVAQIVLDPGPARHQIHLLAHGCPTSLFEAIHLVEAALNRSLYLQIDPRPQNARHMSFRPSALPAQWQPTSLPVGIARLVADIRKGPHAPTGIRR